MPFRFYLIFPIGHAATFFIKGLPVSKRIYRNRERRYKNMETDEKTESSKIYIENCEIGVETLRLAIKSSELAGFYSIKHWHSSLSKHYHRLSRLFYSNWKSGCFTGILKGLCSFLKNSYFMEHLRMAVSVINSLL